ERGTQHEAERDESHAEHYKSRRHRHARRRPDRGEIANRVVDRRVTVGHGPRHGPRGHERGWAHDTAYSKEPSRTFTSIRVSLARLRRSVVSPALSWRGCRMWARRR